NVSLKGFISPQCNHQAVFDPCTVFRYMLRCMSKIILLICCVSGCLQTFAATDADKLLGRDRNKIFDEYVAQIRDFQVVSEKGLGRLGTTWSKSLERSRRRFQEAKSREDVFYAILSLQRSFHDAHSHLEANDLKPDRPKVFIPIKFEPFFNGEG